MTECHIHRPMMKASLRRTKIVATRGPAVDMLEVLRALVAAGMDAARLNLSHGTHEDHAQTIARVRALRYRVVEGGVLQNRKGVNFPDLNFRLHKSLHKGNLIQTVTDKPGWRNWQTRQT
jgi:pyruvate kinase